MPLFCLKLVTDFSLIWRFVVAALLLCTSYIDRCPNLRVGLSPRKPLQHNYAGRVDNWTNRIYGVRASSPMCSGKLPICSRLPSSIAAVPLATAPSVQRVHQLEVMDGCRFSKQQRLPSIFPPLGVSEVVLDSREWRASSSIGQQCGRSLGFVDHHVVPATQISDLPSGVRFEAIGRCVKARIGEGGSNKQF